LRNLQQKPAFNLTKAARQSPPVAAAEMKGTRLMKRLLLLPACAAALLITGCSHPKYYAAPPPPAYAPGPSVIDLGGRNGYSTGAQDGSRDASFGYPYAPRRTRAYHDTPGYDPNVGPRGPYVNAFRNAYLQGYDKAFYRR
jgi:hypothetical protein